MFKTKKGHQHFGRQVTPLQLKNSVYAPSGFICFSISTVETFGCFSLCHCKLTKMRRF